METRETAPKRTKTVGLCTTCAHCIPDDPETNGRAARTCARSPWLPMVLLHKPHTVALDSNGRFFLLTSCEDFAPH